MSAQGDEETRVGPFVLEGHAGEGGQGTVFRARHQRTGQAYATRRPHVSAHSASITHA